jgi:crotonobetainyl-CoA:carnitine CoA-transferase CaiB-like acyl-CoA transferase
MAQFTEAERMQRRERPLAGIRVLDSADVRGELCGRVLADLGAEVIRIEPPAGAASRQLPPFAPNGGGSLYFAFRNAGKRSVVLDLDDERDRDRLHRQLARADVWIESGRPSALAARDLDPEAVLERHPRLILASITDFGQTGPYRDFEGTDMVGYALGGMMFRAGAAHRPPVVAPGSQAYDAASVTAAFGIATAYHQRERCGRGQWLDVSVQETTACMADWSVPIYSKLGVYTHREGAGMWPVYACRDGWVRVIVIAPHSWRALCDWMGNPEELRDPKLEVFTNRLERRVEIEALIGRFFRDQRMLEAAREAQSRGIATTPVLRPAEVIDNEHTRARRSFVELDLLPGRRAAVASGFVEFDGVRLGPRCGAPSPGEHDREVLGEEREPGSEARPAREALGAASGGSAPGPEPSLFPFAGISVLDFGVGIAGVEVARLLGEYGADVIKIESSGALDFIRGVLPGPMNPPFASSNRNKRSFGVDLKSATGLELVRRLVPTADVIVENSGTGVMDRLGLGYEDAKVLNPRIVYFSSQLLGASGPWKNWVGYGPNTHAVSGLQYLWNYPEDAGEPAGSANIHPDHLVGRLGALAVAAALIQRERDGVGVHIEAAQFEAIIQLLGDLFAKESLAPGSVGPAGNSSECGAPWGAYPCEGEDEWCVVNVRSDREWRALREVMGDPDWASLTRYDVVEGRRDAAQEIDQGIAAWTRERKAIDVMHALQARGVPAGVVAHPAHQMSDPHLAERGYFRVLDQVALGQISVEGMGFRGTRLPEPRLSSAPLLGEQTRAICRDLLGLSDEEVDALIAEGVLEENLPEDATS